MTTKEDSENNDCVCDPKWHERISIPMWILIFLIFAFLIYIGYMVIVPTLLGDAAQVALNAQKAEAFQRHLAFESGRTYQRNSQPKVQPEYVTTGLKKQVVTPSYNSINNEFKFGLDDIGIRNTKL